MDSTMRSSLLCFLFLVACSTPQKSTFVPDFKMPGPSAIVYKTKGDYTHLVPVTLSDDKTKIVSYPHPNDLKTGGNLLLPVSLHSGYLLDQKGIISNTAFLKLTYEEYAQLKEVPTLTELYSLIIDKDPFIEVCNCGNKSAFSNQEKQLNELIDSKQLKKTCKTLQ